MMNNYTKTFVSRSYDETVDLGYSLGKLLKKGDCVAFFGGLGAGKTAFVTGIARAVSPLAQVSSPTFAIVNVYPGSPSLCHFDMYRVDTWESLYSTGFFDYLEGDTICAVEWSENIENALPEGCIFVEISSSSENERIVTVKGDERIEHLGS